MRRSASDGKKPARNRGADMSGARFIARSSNVQEDDEKQSLPPPEPEEIEGLNFRLSGQQSFGGASAGPKRYDAHD
jgi:hypothetical protein